MTSEERPKSCEGDMIQSLKIQRRTERHILTDLAHMHGIHLFRLPTPIPTFKVNIYFLESPIPILIDTPPDAPNLLEELENGLNSIGYSLRNIKVIIVTHPHFDHYGSARTIVEMSEASVWATRGTGEWITNFEQECAEEELFNVGSLDRAGVPARLIDPCRRYFRFMKQFARGVPISRVLKEGEVLDLGSLHLTIQGVPGHTPWCTMLYDDKEKIAFTGDFLLEQISPNPLIQRLWKVPKGYKSLQVYLSSLKRVGQMNLRLALPGHGCLIRNPSERIENLLTFIEERTRGIIQRFTGGRDRTVFDLIEEIFPGLPHEQLFLAVSEVSAHIEVLQDEGVLKKTQEFPDHFGLNTSLLSG